jgi:anti-sigma factor RsiW
MLTPSNAVIERQAAATAANDAWLDNAAAYYKLSVNAGDAMLVDVPASNDPREALQKISQSLPQQIRLPDLKPWGLTFRGARLLVADGRPAAQLAYTTDNKAIGPLTLVIGASQQPDIPPTLGNRLDVSLLYWRHHGHAYALVGKTDIGWLWNIANDVAWQLDSI